MKIFLDIDGVMVHANPQKTVPLAGDGFYVFSTAATETLNAFLSRYNSHEIILSTSHRHRFAPEQWKKIFHDRGITVNTISVISTLYDPKTTRKEEIINYITTHQLSDSGFIIIDDDKSLNGLPENLKKRLALTNPYTGLNEDSGLETL